MSWRTANQTRRQRRTGAEIGERIALSDSQFRNADEAIRVERLNRFRLPSAARTHINVEQTAAIVLVAAH